MKKAIFIISLVFAVHTSFAGRFYSPDYGRWLNRDPIGVEGGINVYNSVSNNMVNGYAGGLTHTDGMGKFVGTLSLSSGVDPWGFWERAVRGKGHWKYLKDYDIYEGEAIASCDKESLKKLATMITGDPNDAGLLSRKVQQQNIKKGDKVDISPLLIKLELDLRSNVAKYTQGIRPQFGSQTIFNPSPHDSGVINHCYTEQSAHHELDCVTGAGIAMTKGLIQTLKPGEFNQLFRTTDIVIFVNGLPDTGSLMRPKIIRNPSDIQQGDWWWLEQFETPGINNNHSLTIMQNFIAFDNKRSWGFPKYSVNNLETIQRANKTGSPWNKKVKFLKVEKIGREVFDLRNARKALNK